ncbi:bifunctional Glutamate-cysteine ligase catalytic subunit/Glutamine synthetase-guanido kinase [Babesia duncani]|uniref:Glutamate--cysteine ligase n=1 Tax=Babesia duncani TaxID=323732 RepID=A0AAD9UMI2_9APIC|nr:bifunctional Glutamate-cysteine ligase catalytic subunit/Glutamine synthetase-guanido kinase [Babesia duncani]KAK2197550.1 bifunctional Glutamate-cysteine ligase catalytic subunit/Glutamine synthetase-guanido kinase [Babesia duncani]
MGYLTSSEPLGYEMTRQVQERMRRLATFELLVTYYCNINKRFSDRMFGDELEFMILHLDAEESNVKVVPCSAHMMKYFSEIKNDEYIKFSVHPEFASYMIEAIPKDLFNLEKDFAVTVLESMKHQRETINKILKKMGIKNSYAFTLSSFPLLGCKDSIYLGNEDFQSLLLKKNGGLRTLYAPDMLASPHPRFLALARNIRCRRGKRVNVLARRHVPLTTESRELIKETISKEPIAQSLERLAIAIIDTSDMLCNIPKDPEFSGFSMDKYCDQLNTVGSVTNCEYGNLIKNSFIRNGKISSCCYGYWFTYINDVLERLEGCIEECRGYQLDLTNQLPHLAPEYSKAVHHLENIGNMYLNIAKTIPPKPTLYCTSIHPCIICSSEEMPNLDFKPSVRDTICSGPAEVVGVSMDKLPDGPWSDYGNDEKLEAFIDECIAKSDTNQIKLEHNKFSQTQQDAKNVRYDDVDVIHMDAMVFGMGMSCIQTTFSCQDEEEARYLYDQMLVLSPLFLALTASTVAFRGQLADTNTRWSVLSDAVDDRPDEEKQLFNKSRFSSASLFISRDELHVKNYSYLNDIKVPANVSVYQKCKKIDPIIARHFAYILGRDPVIAYENLTTENFSDCHFEIFQSASWNSVRFKPPPLVGNEYPIPWRVEFRCCEIQLTDFENAAIIGVVALMVKTMIRQHWKLYMPISQVDANIETSQEIDACKKANFFFPKTPFQTRIDTQKCTLEEIFTHPENGLFVLCKKQLDEDLAKKIISQESHKLHNEYMGLFIDRCHGSKDTNAAKMRRFFTSQRSDGIITKKMLYDAIVAIQNKTF